MHGEAWAWSQKIKNEVPFSGRTVEIGSYNHNGSVRDLFDAVSSRYIGIDVIPGRGVEYVGNITVQADLEDFINKYGYFDTILTTETLEHTPAGPLVDAMMRLFDTKAPVLRLMITCAGFNRIPHGHDGGIVKPGEWYANVNPTELEQIIQSAYVDTGLDKTHGIHIQVEGNEHVHDTYAYVVFVKR
jgi:hypothetical protein